MGSDWKPTTIGEHFELVTGYAFKSKAFLSAGIPVIKIKNVKAGHFSDQQFSFVAPEFLEKLANKVAQPEDLLISMSGNRHDGSPATWVGKIAYFRKLGNYLINQRVGALRLKPDSDLDPRFMAYLLSSWHYQEFFISIATSSGGQANISPKQILGASFKFPSRTDQQSIAHILGTLDDKIELNRRMNRTLEAIARGIFKSWFIDFDPVIDNAILNGKPIPNEFAARAEVRREILARNDEGVPGYRDLFPDEFQDSKLGPIPNGWETDELKNLLKLSRESVKALDRPAEKFDHFSIPAFDAGRPSHDLGETIRSSKYLVPSSAVLISKLNPHLPRVWLPEVCHKRCAICSTEFLVCVPKSRVSREYIYCLLSSTALFGRFVQLVTGTTGSHQRVRPTAFLKMDVVVPPLNLRETFANSVRPMQERSSALSSESGSLAAARDSLLPELLAGRFANRT